MKNVQEIAKWLTPKVPYIVSTWLNQPTVKEIFQYYKISSAKFAKKFGEPVLQYNIGVLEETKKIDNCPVMNKFVELMLQKGIQSKDIYLVCTSLRTTVLRTLYKSYTGFSQDFESIERIILIFDRNLSGVLYNFDQKHISNVVKDQQNQHLRTYIHRLQSILDAQSNIIFKVRDGNLFIANKALLAVTGNVDMESFKKRYHHPLEFINDVSCFAQFFHLKEYETWLEKVLKENNAKCKVTIFDHISNKNSSMTMKVVKLGEGFDYVITMDELSESDEVSENMNTLVYKDALTNMANFTKFQLMVEEHLDISKDESFNILMIHLDGFKVYSDLKGREEAQPLIQEVADKLKELYPQSAAKIDEERFAILDANLDHQAAENVIEKVNGILEEKSDGLKAIAALVVRQKEDTVELMLARGDTILSAIEIDPVHTIVDDSFLSEQERIRRKNENRFLTEMKQLKDDKETLPITNYYLEIAIKSDAEILNISENTMAVTVRKISLFSLKYNDVVYIERKEGENLKAIVKDVDRLKNILVLYKFEYVKFSPLDRKNVHVKLEQLVRVTLNFSDKNFEGELESVSIDTFVVLLQHVYDLQENVDLKIKAMLNEKDGNYKGTVRKIVPIPSGFKVVINIQKNYDVENILRSYISNRQIKIIKELQERVI